MKARPNKLDPFASRLDEWAAAGKTLAEMQAELKADGCNVALSGLSQWLARRRSAALERNLFELIATGGQMNRELDSAFRENPEPSVERLIQVTKSLVMSLQVQGTANPKMLSLANSMQQTVLNYLSGETKAKIALRQVGLSEQKYRDEVAEKKAAMQAEIDKAKSTGGLTADTLEKIERELKLL